MTTAENEAYEKAKDHIAQLEAELADFQASSHELEQELELELQESEERHKESQLQINRLTAEVQVWKDKYKDLQKDYATSQASFQREISALRDAHKQSNHRLREIEMTNDDMERNERIAKSTLEDMEQKYHLSLEQVAMLEAELESHEDLQVQIQRLKDELRETNEELAIATSRSESLAAQVKALEDAASATANPSSSNTTSPAINSASKHMSVHSQSSSKDYSHSSDYVKGHAYRHSSQSSVSSMATSSRSLRKVHGMLDQMKMLESRVANFKSSLPIPISSTPTTPASPTFSTSSRFPSTATDTANSARPTSPVPTIPKSNSNNFLSIFTSRDQQQQNSQPKQPPINGKTTPSNSHIPVIKTKPGPSQKSIDTDLFLVPYTDENNGSSDAPRRVSRPRPFSTIDFNAVPPSQQQQKQQSTAPSSKPRPQSPRNSFEDDKTLPETRFRRSKLPRPHSFVSISSLDPSIQFVSRPSSSDTTTVPPSSSSSSSSSHVSATIKARRRSSQIYQNQSYTTSQPETDNSQQEEENILALYEDNSSPYPSPSKSRPGSAGGLRASLGLIPRSPSMPLASKSRFLSDSLNAPPVPPVPRFTVKNNSVAQQTSSSSSSATIPHPETSNLKINGRKSRSEARLQQPHKDNTTGHAHLPGPNNHYKNASSTGPSFVALPEPTKAPATMKRSSSVKRDGMFAKWLSSSSSVNKHQPGSAASDTPAPGGGSNDRLLPPPRNRSRAGNHPAPAPTLSNEPAPVHANGPYPPVTPTSSLQSSGSSNLDQTLPLPLQPPAATTPKRTHKSTQAAQASPSTPRSVISALSRRTGKDGAPSPRPTAATPVSNSKASQSSPSLGRPTSPAPTPSKRRNFFRDLHRSPDLDRSSPKKAAEKQGSPRSFAHLHAHAALLSGEDPGLEGTTTAGVPPAGGMGSNGIGGNDEHPGRRTTSLFSLFHSRPTASK